MKKLLAATLCGVALSAWSGAAAYAQGLQGLGDAMKKDVDNAAQQEVQGATGKLMGKTGAAANTGTGAAVKGAADDAGAGAVKGAAGSAGADTQGGGAGQGQDEPE